MRSIYAQSEQGADSRVGLAFPSGIPDKPMPGRRSPEKMAEREARFGALKHVRQAEGRVAKREVRVTAREQLAPVLNHEACQLALHAAAVVQTATRLAAHQLGDDFNERTASTTTEARKSAPRAAH